MHSKIWFILGLLFGFVLPTMAQNTPTINPVAVFTTIDGKETEPQTEYSGAAPLKALLKANAQDAEGWSAYYEWRITLVGENTPYIIRHEPQTEVTFLKAGEHHIVLFATFTRGSEVIAYTEEHWSSTDALVVTIAESKLEMPNAFSPNNDNINDIYKAKDGWQSLIEFHAYIFNRWGQKLFEWTNPSMGWDGKFNGKDVPDGVYFCLVKAKGADGRKFDIRTDVNLLRGYIENGRTPANP